MAFSLTPYIWFKSQFNFNYFSLFVGVKDMRNSKHIQKWLTHTNTVHLFVCPPFLRNKCGSWLNDHWIMAKTVENNCPRGIISQMFTSVENLPVFFTCFGSTRLFLCFAHLTVNSLFTSRSSSDEHSKCVSAAFDL